MKRRGLPKYASEYKNQHGVWTVRFRRKGFATVYPKALPGTDEFADEYRRWLAGQPATAAPRQIKPGSLRALSVSYYGSASYRSLKASTASVYRNIIEKLCHDTGSTGVKIGDMPAAAMQREHIVKLMAKRKPNAANRLRKILRALMQHAIEIGIRKDDPTRDVRQIRIKTDGFHTWTEEEILQFANRHRAGSKAHLALALLLYTGQRRSDVVRMGRQHVRGDFIHVKQEKTGAELLLPILPALRAAIDSAPKDNMTFLVTALGKPFSPAGFGNWFRDRCNEANLPHCSAHGLRKAAARRLAEIGCTPHEIAAITGHTSLAEVQRYTRRADQRRLAEAAAAKINPR